MELHKLIHLLILDWKWENWKMIEDELIKRDIKVA